MKLFDEGPRLSDAGARYGESDFRYINRSGRVEFARVREVLTSWFDRYPEGHQPDLCERLRNDDSKVHGAALFELFLHEIFVRLGFQVSVHPELPTTARHPDFLLVSEAGYPVCYVEAIRASGESDLDRAAAIRLNRLYDALDTIRLDGLVVSVEIVGSPIAEFPSRQIAREVQRRFSALTPFAVEQAWDGGTEDELRLTFDHAGARLNIYPMSAAAEPDDDPGRRSIGMLVGDAQWLSIANDLRKALKVKARRFGNLDLPYVVAANWAGFPAERSHLLDALFGSRSYQLEGRGSAASLREIRKADGLWTYGGRTTNTTVSAVLFCTLSHAWSAHRSTISFVPNPWAKLPVGPFPRVSHYVAGAERLHLVEGERTSDVLGLCDRFPECA